MRYGPVTVERHLMLAAQGTHLHVFVNGEDVTTRCRFADDRSESMCAELLLQRNGRPYLDENRELAMEVITSGVEIREGDPL